MPELLNKASVSPETESAKAAWVRCSRCRSCRMRAPSFLKSIISPKSIVQGESMMEKHLYEVISLTVRGIRYILYVNHCVNAQSHDFHGTNKYEEVPHMKKRILSLTLAVMMLASALPASAGYADVAEGHWATGVIDKWSDYGVLQGNAEGNFMPDTGLTLAELAVVLTKTFGYIERTSAEVTPAWADEYVEKAIAAGVIEASSVVNAMGKVSRQEAVRLIALAYGVAAAEGETTFADNGDISAACLPYVKAFQDLGFVRGKDGNVFDPLADYTRAEAMQVIDNMTDDILDADTDGGEYTKNLIIRTEGITLSNATVKGNLIISQGVGDGDVILDRSKI